MKANRFAARDEGVSSVVAAVLVFSLFSTAFLLWSINQLPDWIEGREKNHLDGVRQSFAALQASTERMSSNDDPGPVTQGITLSAPAIPLLQGSTIGGSLKVETGFNVTGSFANTALHVVGGTAAGGPSAPLSESATAIQSLETLLLRFTSSGVDNNDWAWVQMNAVDGGGDSVTARVVFTKNNGGTEPTIHCSSDEVRMEVTTPLGGAKNILIDCGDFADDLDLTELDLLERRFGIASGLDQLAPGYAISWTNGGGGNGGGDPGSAAGSQFAAVWQDAFGTTRVAGNGLAAAYALDESGSRLLYDGNPEQHPDQDISWEGGAVAIAQENRAVLSFEPSFVIDTVGAEGFLRWTLTTLTGESGLSGNGEATVAVTHGGTTDVVFTTTGGTIDIESDAASGWARFWTDEIAAAAATNVTVGQSGNIASLVLEDGGTVTAWTVHLRIISASVQVS